MSDRTSLHSSLEASLSGLTNDIPSAIERIDKAIDSFISLYGEDKAFSVFSVSGRSEICGNHTDHNLGKVTAAAVDVDIIAVAARTEGNLIKVKSEGFDGDTVDISSLSPVEAEKGTSAAIIRGVCDGLKKRNRNYIPFCAYTTSKVPKGSGLSSSAAFEDMIGTIENHFANGGSIEFTELSQISQYAENVYFGKPCGLMDQIACSAGGFVFIDFKEPEAPVTTRVDFDISSHGYALYIVNTGGNHADLTSDYASIPAEMKSVAAFFGKKVLRGITEEDIISKLPELRSALGDRAILRALHFISENDRVSALERAVKSDDIDAFLSVIRASGESSQTLLQNYYTVKNPSEQGISLACALAKRVLGNKGACRVHGGGFAGTIQAFVPFDKEEEFVSAMEKAFGHGSVTKLSVRPRGAVRLY